MIIKAIKYVGSIGLFIFLFINSSFVEKNISSSPFGRMLQYKIHPSSILLVNGKTNVNSFCCNSNEQYTRNSLSYQLNEVEGIIYFENTELKVSIDDLDCGMNAINRDLKKALLAEQYPNIIIYLKEAINSNCSDFSNCDEWVEFDASTDVTITCETRPVVIPLKVSKMDEGTFRIKGKASLKLCDFAIEAPTTMMGLIKVEDEIEISFDLIVDIV